MKADSVLAAFRPPEGGQDFDSAGVVAGLDDLLRLNVGFQSAVVADGSGRIVASVPYEGGWCTFPRKSAGEWWFKEARKTGKPCYGPLTQAGGHVGLVWSRPLYGGRPLGLRTFRGVIAAFVNVGACLKNFSGRYGCPFELRRGGELFFHTDDWRADLAHEADTLTLMGGVSFQLLYANTRRPGAGGSPSDSPAAAVGPAFPDRSPEPEMEQSAAPLPIGGGKGSRWLFVVVFIAIGAAAAVAIIAALGPGRRRAAGATAPSRAPAVSDEDKEAARSAVIADLYREIRSQIEGREAAKIESEVRERIKAELRRQIEKKYAGAAREALSREVTEKERCLLMDDARQRLSAAEQDTLRVEARRALLDELKERLRAELGGQLEIEALQELTAAIAREVRSSQGKSLRERALRELEERVRQEVAVRERSLLTAQAREALKGQIEHDLRAAKGVGRDERVTAHDTGGLLRRLIDDIEASGTIAAVARTAALLREQREALPQFSLGAAQTADLIDFLEKVSGRLNSFFDRLKATAGKNGADIDKKETGVPAEDSAAAPVQGRR